MKKLRTALVYLAIVVVLIAVGIVLYTFSVSERTAAAMRGSRGMSALVDPLRSLVSYYGLVAFVVVLVLSVGGAYWLHRRERREIEAYNLRKSNPKT